MKTKRAKPSSNGEREYSKWRVLGATLLLLGSLACTAFGFWFYDEGESGSYELPSDWGRITLLVPPDSNGQKPQPNRPEYDEGGNNRWPTQVNRHPLRSLFRLVNGFGSNGMLFCAKPRPGQLLDLLNFY